ncbi:MAG: endonuclease [Bacteroidota bacterium]
MALLVASTMVLAGCFESRPSGTSTAGPYVPANDEQTVLPNVYGDELVAALDAEYSPDRVLGYGPARDALYAYEQRTDGFLRDFYTGTTVQLPAGDPSQAAGQVGFNAEHVWPQSLGARAEPLRSDMHHLFPVRQQVNSSRGNLPFGEVPDARADAWYRLEASQSSPPREDLDEWSERGLGRFEPREDAKGDVARAVFYVRALYPGATSGQEAFFESMRQDLLRWNDVDPPTPAEVARSAWIAEQQGTPNPFVIDRTLARRAFGTASSTPAQPIPPTGSADGPLWISEIHYDNAGDDLNEGIEVQGPPGMSLDGWTLVLVNGNDGLLYTTLALSGGLPSSGAVWTPAVVQNGSPDAVALVAPDGSVREFLSYEGTLTGADGPVRGLASADIGVGQTPSTPVGQSLARTGPTSGWRLGPATPGR